MRKTSLFFFAAVLLSVALAIPATAQPRQRLVSPEVNKDGTVTFRFRDIKARSVSVRGDFDRSTAAPTTYSMTEGEGGVWTVTTPSLEPEIYQYSFIVDGQPRLDPVNPFVTTENLLVASRFIVSKEMGDLGDLMTVHDVPHGTISEVWYWSPKLGMNRHMRVYTPAGYSATGKKRYPVMYLCHGGGQDENFWQEGGRTVQIMDNLIAAGKAEPMIVVMANGNAGRPASTVDSPVDVEPIPFAYGDTKKGIDFVFPDVISYVDANYKTIAKKEGRAMCGLSMGGFQTFYFTIDHPEVIGYIGLFSPGALPDWSDPTPAIDQYKANPVIVDGLAGVFAAKPKLYWLGVGKLDGHRQDIYGLRDYLTEKGYPFTYLETEGPHEWTAFRRHLIDFAQKIFK